MRTFATSLCCRRKALLELHSVCGQLCAERASGPFSVCVYDSLSPYTLCHFPLCQFLSFWLSVDFNLTFCVFFASSFCSTNTVALFLSLVPWPKALCKATRKGLLALPLCASMLLSIHFRSFPFFSVTCDHNCFTHTASYRLASGSLKQILYYFMFSPYLLSLILYIPSSLTW